MIYESALIITIAVFIIYTISLYAPSPQKAKKIMIAYKDFPCSYKVNLITKINYSDKLFLFILRDCLKIIT